MIELVGCSCSFRTVTRALICTCTMDSDLTTHSSDPVTCRSSLTLTFARVLASAGRCVSSATADSSGCSTLNRESVRGVPGSVPSQAIPPLLSWKPVNAPCQAPRVKANSWQRLFSLLVFVLHQPVSFLLDLRLLVALRLPGSSGSFAKHRRNKFQ